MPDSVPVSRSLTLDSRDEAVLLFGPRDQYLRAVRDAFAVKVVARGDILLVEGNEEAVSQVERAIQQLRQVARRNGRLGAADVTTVVEVVKAGDARGGPAALTATDHGKYLRPRTDGQGRYVQALKAHDIVLCVGPAGTGKTYLAVGWAVTLLRSGQVKKIVLVRPAVEAGERLGYLPGDLKEKINPYLRPLFDSLSDLMDQATVEKYIQSEVIEIVPLAYMRGRAQPVDSPVLTPTGFRPVGELRPGDAVVGSDGRPHVVEGVFPQGVKPVYRVTMTDRTSTRCCGEHLWTVHTRDDKRRGKPAKVLETRDMIGREKCHHYHQFELPALSGAVVFADPAPVPVDPYALGLLLGDGCITGRTTPAFATEDEELVAALAVGVPGVTVKHKSRVDYVLTGPGRRQPNPLARHLDALGLLGTRSSTKFIPREYLFNTPAVRVSMLQGLLDTDGGPMTQPGRTCRIQYTTCSPRLRDDVAFLVRSLGGVCTVRTRAAAGRTPGFANGRPVPHRNDAHIFDIRLPEWVTPFRLRRKRALYEQHGAGRPMRYVRDIRPEGEAETVCIKVSAADSLYLTDEFILTHNTLSNACIILDEGQNATVPQMKMFLTRMGFNSKIVVTGDMTQVDLPRTIRSGLADAVHRLKNIPGIAVLHLEDTDIVRNPLVQKIVNAYEEDTPRGKKPTG